jgi:lipooligosaccharide transport system permease protein
MDTVRLMRWRPAFDFWLTSYRRVWRATAFSAFLAPLLYLGSLGYGLGNLVNGSGRIDGVAYAAFVAPGILAAGAMQTAFSGSTYPVLGAKKWVRTYHAQLATPLTSADIFTGHLMFVGFRIVLGAAAFLVIGTVLGAFSSIWVVLAFPVAVLCGLAHAGLIMAFSISQETDAGFALLSRFVVVPMFLFAGTFFPLDQLPLGLEMIGWVTPVWHATALCRDLVLGSAGLWASLGHLGYLVVWMIGGFLVGRDRYRTQLAA